MSKCPSIHKHAGCKCIRPEGHSGPCWSEAAKGDGTITRCEWYSIDGKYRTHHEYHTIYPTNAK